MQSVKSLRPGIVIGFLILACIAVLAMHQMDVTHLQTMIFGSQNNQNSPHHVSMQQEDSIIYKNYPKVSRSKRAADSQVMENLDILADPGTMRDAYDTVKLRNLDALVSRLLLAQKELRNMWLTQVKMGKPSRSKRAIDDEHINQTNTRETHQGQTDLKSSLGGAMYVHWGRKTCSNGDTELVYHGVAAGSSYENDGAAANTLCLPHDPEWNKYSDEISHTSIYGAEYRRESNFLMKNAEHLYNHNMPCSVCRSHSRTSSFMLPARNNCYEGWHLEYQGYLMAGHYTHNAASEFISVDEAPEADPAGYREEGGRLFYSVEAICGSLPCPPYVNGRELTCAVCSK
ncbi:hypothetical protein CHS0354_035382 [Potamilus streckersoni]|uniref:Uncharacterized protein n=1 Tax=Potamilus streckersoni TaxID=2493646 RepID=A0AAE0WBD3_9BIVA|nr:hypothetical protein CHS0354_035382 [Potamilus streckersoni]